MCGGGVDLNHTTLTELQNRLTKVEGSVGKVEQDVGKVQVAMDYLNHGALKWVHVSEKPISGGNNVIVDVKGKGKLIAVTISSTNGAPQRKIATEIDGNSVVMNVGEYAGSLVASSAFTARGSSLEIAVSNAQGTKKTDFYISSSVNRIKDKRLFSEKNLEIGHSAFQMYSSTVIGQKEPYQFYNNLKVTVDYGSNVNSEGSTSEVRVLYLLDE